MIALPRLPFLVAASLSTLAAFAVGQSVTAPAHFAAAEGNDWQQEPFSPAQLPLRYQQIHDAVPAGTYRELWVGRDGDRSPTFEPLLLTVEVWMSTAAHASNNAAADFAANHGANKRLVVARKQILIAKTEPGTPIPLPEAFEYGIVFDQPFTHPGGALCWEIVVHSRSGNGSHYFDRVFGQDSNPKPLRLWLGTGCRSSTGGDLVHDDHVGVDWNSGVATLDYAGHNLAPNAPAVVAFGLDNANWNGLPLPLELPGTSFDASGACFVHIAPVVQVPVLVDSAGQLYLSTTAPLDAGANGVNLFTQVLSLDPTANRWGIVTSNGLHRHWIAPYGPVPVSSVQQIGTGAVQAMINSGLIVQLR